MINQMKKNSFVLGKVVCVLFILMLGISCSKDDVSSEESDPSTKELVEQLGFNYSTAKINGDTIFVEDDIVLYKSQIEKTLPRHARIYDMSLFAGNDNKTNFKYYISPGLTDAAAIESAFADLNDLTNILKRIDSKYSPPVFAFYATRVYNASEATVVFNDYYQINNNCGFAEFPTIVPPSGMVVLPTLKNGKNINLNTFHWNNLNTAQRKFLALHELGHTFGLRHTNWRQMQNESEFELVNGILVGAYTIPYTPNSSPNPDPNSIFNAETCGESWTKFTNYDVFALYDVLYGKL